MNVGDLIGGRFLIERLAGRGGMGSVYRALDKAEGVPVALKVLDGTDSFGVDRFLREAKVLATLSHPSIVRYVAQGTHSGRLWLAMEWLEGEDLGCCLERGRLDPADALQVTLRAAEALAVAHAAGIIHRDVKPTNIFLVDCDPRRTKLIDFGVARQGSATQKLTGTGQLIGTAGYMAPEQVSGRGDVDERIDVFALGCVLFEALTGRLAFGGDTALAALAKVLCDEPPRLSDVDARLPAALDAIVGSMLAKDRARRPKDGSEVVQRLEAFSSSSGTPQSLPKSAPISVSRRENRLVSVILVAAPAPDAPAGACSAGEMSRGVARVAERFEVEAAMIAAGVTALPDDVTVRADMTIRDASAYLMVVTGQGGAGDQAARGASIALALREALAHARIAIGTGLAEAGSGLAFGPAVDRAAHLLEKSAAGGDDVVMDDVTAGLLDDRFQVIRGTDGTAELVTRTPTGTASADGDQLLGRATPFVGRDKELSLLEATLDECVEEPVARVVVVTGAVGAGKSRLRREFAKRVGARGGVRIFHARAEGLGAGSALSLVRLLIGSAAGIDDGAEAGTARATLDAYLGRLLSRDELTHAQEFLGDLMGAAPLDAPPSPELVAARSEPRIQAEWTRRAVLDWLRAATNAGPVVTILEDLHWGDAPSVAVLAQCVTELRGAPLFVLGLARPGIHDALPMMRELLEHQEVRLGSLTRRASEQLVRAALGGEVDEETVGRIVARAEGNPFFLEELVRHAADHGSASAPETVLAVVQARLDRLEPEARRVLRAASVFGRTFWRDGVASLLGMDDGPTVEDWLSTLESREVIQRNATERFAWAGPYVFRHDLLRDTAYATLPAVERAASHGAAAEWLERTGERDPLVLADHKERAGDHDGAIEFLAQAVERAEEAASIPLTITLSERALSLAPTGDARARILVAEAYARAWRREWARSAEASDEALTLVAPGSVAFFRAAAIRTYAGAATGDPGPIRGLVAQVLGLKLDREPTGPYGFGIFTMITALELSGERALANAVLAKVDAMTQSGSPDLAFVGWRLLAHVHMSFSSGGAAGRTLRLAREAKAHIQGVGDLIANVMATLYGGIAEIECGAFASARDLCRAVATDPTTEQIPFFGDWALITQARAELALGDLAAARRLAGPMALRDDTVIGPRGRSVLATASFLEGDAERAFTEALAIAEGPFAGRDRLGAAVLAARSLVLLGRAAEATRLVALARGLVDEVGATPTNVSALHLASIEVASALGDDVGRKSAAQAGRDYVTQVASGLDADTKATWFAIPDNARILELAKLEDAHSR